MTRKLLLCSTNTVTLCLIITLVYGQIHDDDGPYHGRFLGELNTYHHQVAGFVYAVDEYTLLIKNFVYDGNGRDTFFWAGSSNQPDPQGLLVPNEHGRTNLLDRYLDEDITINMPGGKKITEFKWFSVFDLSAGRSFGDIYIPQGFEPPHPQKLSQFNSPGKQVRSGEVTIVDSKTISISDFNYDGSGTETYFMVGNGFKPNPKGIRVPDEKGYVDSLRTYKGADIRIEMLGALTVFDVDWVAVFDVASGQNYGHVSIPNGLNVPPSLVEVLDYDSNLPNCEQLHKRLQVYWEEFGGIFTFELVGQLQPDEYMSFGLSGDNTSSQMLGADVMIGYDGGNGIWKTSDFNVGSMSICTQDVQGKWSGVCPDTKLNLGQENFQGLGGSNVDGILKLQFRRAITPPDDNDMVWPIDVPAYIVWAIGELDSHRNYHDGRWPTFHYIYPKADISIDFKREAKKNCHKFTQLNKSYRKPWLRHKLLRPDQGTITARIGPSGGRRGYAAMTGLPSSGLSWFLNGWLAPDVYLLRGHTYTFRIEGGKNPYDLEHYHPFIITDENIGGYGSRSEQERSQIKVFAGVKYTIRGDARPTSSGRLCLWKHKPGADRRLDEDYPSFKKWRNSLEQSCEDGEAALLKVQPNSSWPDTVYYQSYTHPHMGWRMHIIDDLSQVSHAQHITPSYTLIWTVMGCVVYTLLS